MTSRSSPLAVPAFRWLIGGQAVSAVGDQLFPVAVAALVVGRGGSAGDLGIVLAARFAALVLFALLGGASSDRLPRVRVLQAADVLRLVAVSGLAVVAVAGEPGVAVLAMLVFVVGAGEAFSRPAYGALLPSVLPDAALPAANAMSGVSLHIASIAGPGVAGALLLVVRPSVVFALDAVTFAISFATLLRVAEPAAVRVARRRLRREVAEGFGAVRARPWLGAVLAMTAVQMVVVVALVTVLLPVVLRDDVLADPADASAAYGLVLALGAVGGLVGALAAGRWQPARPGAVALLLACGFAAAPLSLLVGAPVPGIALAWFVAMAGLGPFNVWWETALQRAVLRELLARVVSVDWMCSLALLPLGLALTGALVALVGRGPLLVTGAVVLVATALLALQVRGVPELALPAAAEEGTATP